MTLEELIQEVARAETERYNAEIEAGNVAADRTIPLHIVFLAVLQWERAEERLDALRAQLDAAERARAEEGKA